MADLLRIKGAQVKLATLGNEHINPASPITEAKLALAFSTAALNDAIDGLSSKKVLTYIGIDGTLSSGTNSSLIVNTAAILAASPSGTAGGSSSVAGIVTSTPNNKVQIRNSTTKQPIESSVGGPDVYGRLTESGGVYTLSYFYDNAGVETAFTMPADVGIDILFPESVNFADLPFNSIVNGVSFVDGLPAAHTHTVSELSDVTVSATDINDLVTADALGSITPTDSGAEWVGLDATAFSTLTGNNLQTLAEEIDAAIGSLNTSVSSIPTAVTNRNGVNVSAQAGQTIFSLGESYVAGTLAFYVGGSKQMRTTVGQEANGQFIETDPAAGTFTVLATTEVGDILAVDYDHVA